MEKSDIQLIKVFLDLLIIGLLIFLLTRIGEDEFLQKNETMVSLNLHRGSLVQIRIALHPALASLLSPGQA
jgi:hypothetical protein